MEHRKVGVCAMARTILTACAIGAGASTFAASDYVPPVMDAATCDQGAASGKDITGSTSSVWYFIGPKPPCPYASSLQKYCARLQTRQGYLWEEGSDALNNDRATINGIVSAFDDDPEAKAQALARYPQQSLSKALQKCGLTKEQLRAKLAKEADAASKTDQKRALNQDFAVIAHWAPDLSLQIWKRECQGHPIADPNSHSESPPLDKYWRDNPRYMQFCLLTGDAFGKAPVPQGKLSPSTYPALEQ